jgi:hypothetical protein
MKTKLAALLAMLGIGSASAAEPPVQMMDPSKLLYTMSTLAGESPAMVPVAEVKPADLVFHEDEWRQVEFYPRSRLAEVESKLTELKAFEAAHARGRGWNQIFLRKVNPAAVVPGADAFAGMEQRLGVKAMPGPILFYGQNSVVGRIADGFSLPLGGGITLYGVHDPSGIQVLAANVAAGGDDQTLVRAFATLSASDHLVLVDWRAHMVLIAFAANGQVEAWRP